MSRKHMWVIVAGDESQINESGVCFGTLEDGKVKYRMALDIGWKWNDLNYKPEDVIVSIVDHLNKNFSEPIK